MLGELFQWFAQLKGFELILWCIALLFSLLFLIQTIISFFIGAGDGDIHSFGDDGHGDGSRFFTLRNMIAFLPCLDGQALPLTKAAYPMRG